MGKLFAKDNAVPPEKIMQYILLFLIVIIPALGTYLELLNSNVLNAKIQYLGIRWVIGYAGFSIAVLAIGLYLIFNNALRNLLFGTKNSQHD